MSIVRIVPIPAPTPQGYQWRWKCEQENGVVSARAFELFYECVEDARRAGHQVYLDKPATPIAAAFTL